MASLRRSALSLGGAALSGVLLAWCYPRFNIESLVWVWASPLMILLWFARPANLRHPGRRGFGLGYLAGIVFFAINLSWITEVTWIGYLVFPFYLGLYFGFWGLFAATVGRPRVALLDPGSEKESSLFRSSIHTLTCAFLNASCWVALEWLRGWLMTGFGWNGLGVAFHDNLTLIQAADLVGVTGLAFMPLFVNAVLVTTVKRFHLEIKTRRMRPHLDFGVALLLVTGVFLYGLGHSLAPPPAGRDLRLVLVQLNIPQDEKWDERFGGLIMDNYAAFTIPAVETHEPDLVVWPESSLPHVLFSDASHVPYFNEILFKGDFHLMLGANELDYQKRLYYNAAVLMSRSVDTHLSVYRKVHLVPFGEFVPFRKSLPFLNDWFERVIPGDFNRGTSTDPLPLAGESLSVVPMICFEDTVGRLARRFVRDEPQLLVNVTNDGWFGKSAAAEQHLANARFRTVELRRPMARACNTGVTCLIDTRGAVTHALRTPEGDIFIEGALLGVLRVPDEPVETFYARHGDLFTGVLTLALLPTSFIVLIRQRRNRKTP